jgi:hypothetical protein
MSQPDCAPRDAIDQVEISSPCSVSWDEMREAGGDGRVRFCGQCRQNVYNVEAMSRVEAHRLIAAREGRVCVRILRRPDGTVVTADCWARLRAARRRGFLPFLGMMVLVGFTELMAIGVGLVRLKGLMEGSSPPPESALTDLPVPPRPSPRPSPPPSPRTMGELPVRPSPPEPPHDKMGGLVEPRRLLGKMKRD